MPIVVSCTGCGRKLRLAEEHAGKTARCPVCRMTFQVPADAARMSDSAAEAAGAASGARLSGSSDDSLGLTGSKAPASYAPSAPAEERWHMRTPEGQEYGPVGKTELDGWVKEGRISADCWVRRENTAQWIAPRDLFPGIPAGSAPGMAPGAPRGGPAMNPYADRGPAGMPTNPYASGYTPAGPYGAMPGYYAGFKKPHRGGTVLVLGIVSWFTCFLINIATLVMANQDLTEMDQGVMDESGRGLTRAGQVLAIIQLCLVGLWLVFVFAAGILGNM